MVFCKGCGALIRADKNYCANCGTRLDLKPQSGRQAYPSQQHMIQERRLSQQALYNQQAHQPAQETVRTELVYSPKYPMQRFEQTQPGEPAVKKSRGKKAAIVLVVILALVIGAAAFAYFYFRSAISNAPDMRANPRGSERLNVADAGNLLRPGQAAGSSGIIRNTDKYTYLILGADEGEYNTDVIMVVTFDSANHTLDVVNIPRDTLVNVSWNTKKANSLLANMRAKHRGEEDPESSALQSTIEKFADVLGFEVDYWVIVNLQAFVSLIDAINGVDFYIPRDMNYDDSWGGLSIHYSEGLHHLSGQQAIEVIRYRSGYASGDIGRIGTQQSFLKSAARQILDKKDSLGVVDLARIFLSNVKTDLKLDDLIWFGYESMKLDAEDVNFYIMPGNISDSFGGNSYVTIYVGEWLEMVNDTFNPFDFEIKADDVSILTRGSDRRLYVTDGNRQGDASWGS